MVRTVLLSASQTHTDRRQLDQIAASKPETGSTVLPCPTTAGRRVLRRRPRQRTQGVGRAHMCVCVCVCARKLATNTPT